MSKKKYDTPFVEVFDVEIVDMCATSGPDSASDVSVYDTVTSDDASMSREFNDGWNRSWKNVWEQ